MKIKICSHAPVREDYYSSVTPTFAYLKSFYDLYGQNPNVEWLMPEYFIFNDVETTVQNFIQQQPDILGLGVYIWNEQFQLAVAKKVKQQLPNTVIVLGGPNLSVHRTDLDSKDDQKDFFRQYPFVDYVVYGDGERPFQQIIDFQSGYIKDKKDFVNIVEPDQDLNRIFYPLEILSDKDYLAKNCFHDNKELLAQQVKYLESNNLPKSRQVWAVEFARGCMYKCTFCDWSQNLTKKVKRRTNDWQLDIDTFIELDVAIRETDANFGMWKDDIAAFDYCISKYDPNKNFKLLISNTPKLNKDITEYIMLKSAKTYGSDIKISLQDTSEDVLQAIDRPSPSWQRIQQMVLNLRKEVGEHHTIAAEIIVGLPGQTLDHIIENIIKLNELKVDFYFYEWEYLTNSPASDTVYKKLWQIETKQIIKLHSPQVGGLFGSSLKFDSLEQAYKTITKTDQYAHMVNNVQGIYSTRHMSIVELIAARHLYNSWNAFVFKKSKNKFIQVPEKQIRKILNTLKQQSIETANQQFEFHKPYIEKYNCMIWGSWQEDQKQLLHTFN